MVASAHRIPAPRPPEPRQPFRFPVLATVAPVIVAVVIWAITSSPFALVFAALGPVTAVASLVDSRIGSRRTARREGARFAAELDATRAVIADRHAEEREALSEAVPGGEAIAVRRGADPGRWARAAASPVPARLGLGRVPSTLELERPARGTDPAVEEQLDRLVSRAEALSDAPVVIDARLGIGVCGPAALAVPFTRALVVQLAWTLSPATATCGWSAPGEESSWLERLPHERADEPSRGSHCVSFTVGDESVFVAVAPTEAELPAGCRAVVRLGGGDSASLVQHPDRDQRRAFRPEFLSLERAIAWAEEARRDATAQALTPGGSLLPHAVELAPLLRTDHTPPGSLACEPGVGRGGPLTLDLVHHGPHAVVGGTTGSGKSELLVSWVLAMAAAAPPAAVTFLLVDFKGGSAFAALAALPHTVGIITDLDAAEAARALASLRAELRHRERMLAAAGARGVDELPDLPRLVIVADEFAAMLAEHPDLHALFADLAARGRSLGIHLVLCTQRPAGVVRDAVLANADLRVSLRVNNRADSSAVVGSDAAAAIPAAARGRGYVALAGETAQPIQFALATDADAARVARLWPGAPPPRRPWCEPLPAVVASRDLPGLGFGLLDLPDEQRRGVAAWDSATDGHVLVLGAAGSGVTTALAALAPGAQWLSPSIDAAWDVIDDLVERVEGVPETCTVDPGVTVIDDLDSLLARFSAEHRVVVAERLTRVLRDGPGRGIHLAIGARRLTAELQGIAALTPSRLFLRHASRQDLVLAGGEGSAHVDRLPPGGGSWRGQRVQVARVDVPVIESTARVADLAPDRPLAIVTTRPAALLARPGAVPLAGGDPHELVVSEGRLRPMIVGDVEEWQSRWGALTSLRPVADILFDGCSLADVRALTRSRDLPPPLVGVGLCWRLAADGGLERVRP